MKKRMKGKKEGRKEEGTMYVSLRDAIGVATERSAVVDDTRTVRWVNQDLHFSREIGFAIKGFGINFS